MSLTGNTMLKFNIIFYKGDSLVSRFIRKITRSKEYSHCAFLLDDGFHCLELAWNNPCVVKHFKYKSHEYDTYELKFELSEKQIQELKRYIIKYLNSGYDFKYLITRGLNFLLGTPIKNSKRTMTCDELIVESFRHIGINLIDGDVVMTPELLSESKLLRKST